MSDLNNLKHVEIPIKSGGVVYVLDKGEVIDSEADAMLQALHSRSVGGLKHHLTVLEEKGASKFMSSFYVGYGHKSIGDCGSATLFIEGVSMLAAKAIQDNKLYSGQEASTRYIDFSMQAFINPLKTKKGEELLEHQRKFYLDVLPKIQQDLIIKFPIKEGENEKIYEKAINAKAFDIARGFLPSGASTNLAWHSNLRQIADKLLELRHHPLEEVRFIAEAIEKAVLEKYPNSFTSKRYDDTENYCDLVMKNYLYHDSNSEKLELEYNINEEQLEYYKPLLKNRPNSKTEVPKYLSCIGEVSAKFNLDFGSFRDLQRHRALNQRMPLITLDLGFHEWYINSLPQGIIEDTKSYLEDLKKQILDLDTDKETLQYYIPMGYKISNFFTGDLPALIYMVELRNTRFVHPTLRFVAIDIAKDLAKKLDVLIYLDDEPDRFDIKRGTHDIELKG